MDPWTLEADTASVVGRSVGAWLMARWIDREGDSINGTVWPGLCDATVLSSLTTANLVLVRVWSVGRLVQRISQLGAGPIYNSVIAFGVWAVVTSMVCI